VRRSMKPPPPTTWREIAHRGTIHRGTADRINKKVTLAADNQPSTPLQL
jgi:hypothetical protein